MAGKASAFVRQVTHAVGLKRFLPRLLLPILGMLSASEASASEAKSTAGRDPSHASVEVRGTPLLERTVRDRLGRKIRYYVSKTARRTPMLMFIQGSGCATVLSVDGDRVSSGVFDLLPLAEEGRFTVVVVDKPFSSAGRSDGTAVGCSPDFLESFTAETWLVALQAAFADARQLPWVDARRALVYGASEGAVMASLLAARTRSVTDLMLFSGSGTTQAFDFIVAAYGSCFDRTACLLDLDRKFAEISAAPESSAIAWGHPYKRWSSFFRIDPSEELKTSQARIYLAMGTMDAVVPPLSQEIAVAKLRVAGRDLTVRRVKEGDHSLMRPGADGYGDLDREIRLGLEWFWKGGDTAPPLQVPAGSDPQ